jgi:hypothetical protein
MSKKNEAEKPNPEVVAYLVRLARTAEQNPENLFKVFRLIPQKELDAVGAAYGVDDDVYAATVDLQKDLQTVVDNPLPEEETFTKE